MSLYFVRVGVKEIDEDPSFTFEGGRNAQMVYVPHNAFTGPVRYTEVEPGGVRTNYSRSQ